MTVTFPHMGTMAIVLKALFTKLGCNVLLPPPVSKRTLEIGTRLSPETICLPFKMTLGNFVEALENGADTLITCGGVGPCRLGYYAEIQRSLLQMQGFRFTMLTVEPSFSSLVHNLRQVMPTVKWQLLWSAFRLAGTKMAALDTLDRQVNRVRCRELEPGASDAILQSAIAAIDQARTVGETKKTIHAAEQRLGRLTCRSVAEPLRISITGELYVLQEPFINQAIVRRLGQMGVEVDNTMYLSDYVQAHLFRQPDTCLKLREQEKMAKPYLAYPVGGHALRSVAQTVHSAQQGVDGVIHVYPFTCMPEIIAKNILPKVSRDMNLPLLTLAYDEQTGDAGVKTRLEAFVDLLHCRSRRKQESQ